MRYLSILDDWQMSCFLDGTALSAVAGKRSSGQEADWLCGDVREALTSIQADNANHRSGSKFAPGQPLGLRLLAHRGHMERGRSDRQVRSGWKAGGGRGVRCRLHAVRSGGHLLRWDGGKSFWSGAEGSIRNAPAGVDRDQMRHSQTGRTGGRRALSLRFLGGLYRGLLRTIAPKAWRRDGRSLSTPSAGLFDGSRGSGGCV